MCLFSPPPPCTLIISYLQRSGQPRLRSSAGLSPTSPTSPGGGKVMIQRSPSAIKQCLLDWCVKVTRDYDVRTASLCCLCACYVCNRTAWIYPASLWCSFDSLLVFLPKIFALEFHFGFCISSCGFFLLLNNVGFQKNNIGFAKDKGYI